VSEEARRAELIVGDVGGAGVAGVAAAERSKEELAATATFGLLVMVALPAVLAPRN